MRRGLPAEYDLQNVPADKCRDCGAAIYWVVTNSGKKMPVDEQPANNGTVCLLGPVEPYQGVFGKLGVVLSGLALEQAHRLLIRLYKSHHMTCPNAKNRRLRAVKEAA